MNRNLKITLARYNLHVSLRQLRLRVHGPLTFSCRNVASLTTTDGSAPSSLTCLMNCGNRQSTYKNASVVEVEPDAPTRKTYASVWQDVTLATTRHRVEIRYAP